MAITVSENVPASFRAGTTVPWSVTYPDFPASESWELRYFFRREGGDPIEFEATANGDAFEVTLTAAQTAKFSDGRYEWHAIATKQGTGTDIAGSGVVDVWPDPTKAHTKSFSEEALEMVEASIRGDLPTAQESINLAGLDITKMSLSERFALRDRIKAEIARERQRRRLNKGNYRHGLQVRFT